MEEYKMSSKRSVRMIQVITNLVDARNEVKKYEAELETIVNQIYEEISSLRHRDNYKEMFNMQEFFSKEYLPCLEECFGKIEILSNRRFALNT